MDRRDSDHGSTPGGGCRTPDAALAAAVEHLHAALDELAAIDPAQLTGYGLGEQVAELFTARRRVDGAAGVFGHRFAGTDEWSDYRKPEHFLAAQVSDSHASIRVQLHRSAFITDTLPVIGRAWLAGEVSMGHVNVLKDLHTKFPALREHLVAVQTELVLLAKEQDPGTFRKALMLIAHRADPAAVADDEAEQQQECYLHISEFGDGLVAIDGVLPKDLGSRFLVLMDAAKRSIRRQCSKDSAGESDGDTTDGKPAMPAGREEEVGPVEGPRRGSVTNLDAFQRIVGVGASVTGPDGFGDVFGERPVTHVTVPLASLQAQIDPLTPWQEEALAELGVTPPGANAPQEGADPPPTSSDGRTPPTPRSTTSGSTTSGSSAWGKTGVDPGWFERLGLVTHLLSARYAQYLACDSVIEPVFVDADGRVVATGERQRSIPRWLRRAVTARDVSCRFPGCPYEIAEIHHIEFYSRGGLTVIGNLIGLCLFHHRQIHLENTLIVGDPNKQITFITKHGNTYTSTPALRL